MQDQDDIEEVADRYRLHLRACAGLQTIENFMTSPYFTDNGRASTLHPAWEWDVTALREDQARLARAFVEQVRHPIEEPYPHWHSMSESEKDEAIRKAGF